MGNALISRRGGGYAKIEFDNYTPAFGELESRAAPNLSIARYNLAATTIGNYALFGGGSSNYSDKYSTVDAYNSNLTKSTATALSVGRNNLAATTVEGYALFGGGNSSTVLATVDAYNSSLARSTPTDLSVGRDDLVATTVGNYAIFGGGWNNSFSPAYVSTVDAYNSNLTRSTPTVLSVGRCKMGATTVGNYALFGGGQTANSDVSTTVDAYNNNLTRSTPTVLSVGRSDMGATTVDDYALFGGGGNFGKGNFFDTVDVYNSSLTRSTATSLDYPAWSLAATTVGSYAIFLGGWAENPSSDTKFYSNTVTFYSRNLTRSTTENYSGISGEDSAATAIGNYALFGGGFNRDEDYTLVEVDAFSVNAVMSVYRGSKYKFQNMSSETTVTSDYAEITIPTPVTGYIKIKNVTLS